MEGPLNRRVAVVTGVSRRGGIGFAIAKRLLDDGASALIQSSLTAYELADRGITVNAINPGPVDTGWASEELREQLRPAFPAGRWGQPEDIAAVVRWLVSDDSAWITGQVIDAEGGFRR